MFYAKLFSLINPLSTKDIYIHPVWGPSATQDINICPQTNEITKSLVIKKGTLVVEKGCWLLDVFGSSRQGVKLTACLDMVHPRRPRGGQSGWEKWCTKSFQAQAEKPLGTHSHWTISKCLSERWLLIGHKNALYYCAQSANSISWVSEDGYCL